VGSVWKDEQVGLRASVYHKAGITNVSMTGDKYRSNANWLDAILYGVGYGRADWLALWTEATPASAATWTAWTHNSVSVTGYRPWVELWLFGGYPAAADAYAAIEALTCTITLDSTYVPAGALLGEANNYPLVATLENETTGDAITLTFEILMNRVFSLDGETKSVQYNGYNAFGAVRMDDESRSAYIRLQGNATNTIRITSADLGTLDIVLSWYSRRL
jgi:hypothetical protein